MKTSRAVVEISSDTAAPVMPKRGINSSSSGTFNANPSPCSSETVPGWLSAIKACDSTNTRPPSVTSTIMMRSTPVPRV